MRSPAARPILSLPRVLFVPLIIRLSRVDLLHTHVPLPHLHHSSPLNLQRCLGSLYAASTAVHQLPLDITVCSRALRHAALDVLVYPEVYTTAVETNLLFS